MACTVLWICFLKCAGEEAKLMGQTHNLALTLVFIVKSKQSILIVLFSCENELFAK